MSKQGLNRVERGVVRSTADIGEAGVMKCDIPGVGTGIAVKYVTPFLGDISQGGMFAPPTTNTEILVCQPGLSNSWYYMGSVPYANPSEVVNQPESPAAILAKTSIPVVATPPVTITRQGASPEPDTYKGRGKPTKYMLKSPMGQGLVISDQYTPDYYNTMLKLISTAGFLIQLNDSPLTSNAVISNPHGTAFHMISNEKGDPESAPASQDFRTEFNETHIIQKGEYAVVIDDGRNISMINNSVGGATQGSNDMDWGKITLRLSLIHI